LNTVSPEYAAVMECDPALKLEVVKVAWPATSAPLPMLVPPSRKVTVPPGLPTLELTVAVNVTESPAFDGFNDDPTVVVVEEPVAVLSNRYAVMAPMNGLLPVPVTAEVA
jgi:hypothetical protein